MNVPSSNGVSAATIDAIRVWSQIVFKLRTWPKNDRIPEHNIVWAWTPRDPTRWVAREAFEIPDEPSSAVCGLTKRRDSVMRIHEAQDDLPLWIVNVRTSVKGVYLSLLAGHTHKCDPKIVITSHPSPPANRLGFFFI